MANDPSRPRRRPRPAPAPVHPQPCPACGSNRVIPIIYGLPSADDLHADFAEGRLEVAGCVIPEVTPAWRCRACSQGFGDGLSGLHPEAR